MKSCADLSAACRPVVKLATMLRSHFPVTVRDKKHITRPRNPVKLGIRFAIAKLEPYFSSYRICRSLPPFLPSAESEVVISGSCGRFGWPRPRKRSGQERRRSTLVRWGQNPLSPASKGQTAVRQRCNNRSPNASYGRGCPRKSAPAMLRATRDGMVGQLVAWRRSTIHFIYSLAG